MRLFVLSSCVPHRYHNVPGVTAVHVSVHALTEAWQKMGHSVVLQMIFNQLRTETELTAQERDSLDGLRQMGVEIAEPIFPQAYRLTRLQGQLTWRLGWLSTQWQMLSHYPSIQLAPVIAQRIAQYRPDAAVTIWSPEGVAALHGVSTVPRFVVHGDIDFVPSKIRVQDSEFFTGQPPAPQQQKKALRRIDQYERVHLQLMNEMDIIGNHAASNVGYYQQHGHHHSVYLGNTWIDNGREHAQQVIDAAYHRLSTGQRPIKIIGHVGYLNRTGSNYGLRFLADLLPHLDRVMQGIDYRVHIIGGGKLIPTLAGRLQHPRVVLGGYVEDLDAELESADLFLFLNNAGPLVAAFTRHMVAWASGSCMVVHRASQEAIPEIVHLQNAIVGEQLPELAENIRQAVVDADLNRRIREGGRATYEQHFTPQLVAGRVVQFIDGLSTGP